MKLFAKNCWRNTSEVARVAAQTEFSIFHFRRCELAASTCKSESKSKTEMECTEIFVFMRIGIDSVIEPHRTDR